MTENRACEFCPSGTLEPREPLAPAPGWEPRPTWQCTFCKITVCEKAEDVLEKVLLILGEYNVCCSCCGGDDAYRDTVIEIWQLVRPHLDEASRKRVIDKARGEIELG